MKRLAYLMGTFPALTETFILGEIHALRAQGIDLHLFALRRPKGVHKTPEAEDLAARTLYSPSFLSRRLWEPNLRALRRSPGRYLKILAEVIVRTLVNPVHCLKSLGMLPVAVAFAEVIRERGIERIHAHWANYPATAAYIISRLLNIPYSLTAHIYDATLIRTMMREKFRRAEFVVTCTRWNQQLITALVPEAEGKVLVNYHGIFLDKFLPNGKRLSEDKEKFHIVSCGSLYPRKGFPDLLKACQLLRDRGSSFRCTIIGEGPLRPRLERFIREHQLEQCVDLLGALPQREVIRHYQKADLFVLPCMTDHLGWDELFSDPLLLLEVGLAIPFRPITDGIPNVLVEAMAMGIPVVSTTVAGIPELIKDGQNGVLVPERNPLALAAAIDRLFKDSHLRRELAQRGRDTVLQRFDRSKNIQELLKIFTAQPLDWQEREGGSRGVER
ncbi:MAG: glycosyltransferase family 4 protein [Deltaproteobacteria bacterium]|nr:glycosyltransferase family 4 protein [Deltaproteobacteria bacterium]